MIFDLNGPANYQVDIDEEDKVQDTMISFLGIIDWLIYHSKTSRLWQEVDFYWQDYRMPEPLSVLHANMARQPDAHGGQELQSMQDKFQASQGQEHVLQ